jgi:SAM-dependent methyltransferase
MSLLVDAARPEDATFLASAMRDIPFAVHSSHEGDRALILGAGAGIDVLRARMHGLRAVAVEINPLMLETAELFVTPSQYAYTGEDVTLVLDDARMFAETTDERFDVILSAKSGRYGGVGADVDFVSYDETVEAFASYLELLRPEGVFVFTTLPRLMENRNITMAIRALERMMLDPEGRIMLIRGREGKEDMLVIGRELFSSDKVAAYTREAAERGFNSIEVLDAATIADYTSRFGLMTDERPVPARFKIDVFGYSLSYIQAMLMILSGLVFFGILLWRRLMRRAAELASRQDLARFMIVLSTSSVGFVVFELLSIQRFFYVLGSPAYVLPTVLATVLLGGSVGSLISSYFADYRYAFRTFSLAMLACLGAYGIALDTSFEVLVMHTDAVRIGAVVLILLPPSIALGAFFPLSMRYAALRTPELIPWAWAISGMMAVSGGIVAKFLFASLGFDELLLFLAASYVVIFIAAGRLQAHSHTAS